MLTLQHLNANYKTAQYLPNNSSILPHNNTMLAPKQVNAYPYSSSMSTRYNISMPSTLYSSPEFIPQHVTGHNTKLCTVSLRMYCGHPGLLEAKLPEHFLKVARLPPSPHNLHLRAAQVPNNS